MFVRTIRAVLFDLDNTLYENDEQLEAWANNILDRCFNAEQQAKLMGVLPQLLAAPSEWESAEAASKHLETVLPGLPPEGGELILRMHRDWLMVMQLTFDALVALDNLEAARIPFGIVTNAPPVQMIKIEGLGLTHRTNCIFISDIFGYEKPHPAIFAAAADKLGLPASEILFVGDAPVADIVGAHNAGMRTAWLSRGRMWPAACLPVTPDYTLESLTELSGIVG
jgi:putative hydrolase of the HAD superfamily